MERIETYKKDVKECKKYGGGQIWEVEDIEYLLTALEERDLKIEQAEARVRELEINLSAMDEVDKDFIITSDKRITELESHLTAAREGLEEITNKSACCCYRGAIEIAERTLEQITNQPRKEK